MAEPATDLMEQVARLDPKSAAQQLIDARKQHGGWLDEFSEQLDRQRNAAAMERVLTVWGLNQSDAARIFGVSRQAISKWLAQGVPAERAEAIADIAAATDLLVHHLKRDRIPAVVRRRAAALDNQSLLSMLERQSFRDVLAACRALFAFGEAHR